MRAPWKMVFPRDVREVTCEGAEARRKAEINLVRDQQELARIQSQTPYYAGLGRDLRVERERNHIAERLRASLLREA